MLETGDLFEILRRKVYEHEGKGFTVEVNAEVIKYEIYKRTPPSLFSFNKKWTWKFYKIDKATKYIGSFGYSIVPTIHNDGYKVNSPSTRVDVACSITKEVESILPAGIIINKSDPVILLDERDLFHTKRKFHAAYPPGKSLDYTHISLIANVEDIYEEPDRKARYIEGCRVYLTITDEYALRIYRELCHSLMPRENVFLTKHKELLKEIIRGTDEVFAYGSEGHYIYVDYSHVCIRYMVPDGAFNKHRTVYFESLGMKPLNTHEQLIAIAFAFIEIMKNMYPEWESIPLPIENNKVKITKNSVTIGFRKQNLSSFSSDSTKLNDW